MHGLLRLAFDPEANDDVRALALRSIDGLLDWLERQSPRSALWNAHYRFAQFEINRLLADPAQIEQLTPVTVPPGSPIGSYQHIQ